MRANRTSRGIGAVIVAATLVLVGPSPAHAAAPTNDTFAAAIPIGPLPFTTTLDTTEATTDADDADANATCGAPSTDASVWYSLTAAADGALVVDMAASNYPAGALVLTGSPGAFDVVACGPTRIAFPTTAGTTYHLLVLDDQSDGGGNGGTLVMTIDNAPAPPVISATINPVGGFNPHAGSAIISGTVTCSGVVDIAFVDLQVRQKVGRGEVVGQGSVEAVCDGNANPFSAEAFPTVGTKFSGGKAATVSFAVACGPLQCSVSFQEYQVRLTGRG